MDLDVSSDASVTAAVEHVLGRFGRLDVLVNNAGIGSAGAAEELSVERTRACHTGGVPERVFGYAVCRMLSG